MVGYITTAHDIAQRLSEKWRHFVVHCLYSLFCTSPRCVGVQGRRRRCRRRRRPLRRPPPPPRRPPRQRDVRLVSVRVMCSVVCGGACVGRVLCVCARVRRLCVMLVRGVCVWCLCSACVWCLCCNALLLVRVCCACVWCLCVVIVPCLCVVLVSCLVLLCGACVSCLCRACV